MDIPAPRRTFFSISETFDVGAYSGTSVSPDYAGHQAFPGQLEEVKVQILPPFGAHPISAMKDE